MPCRFSAHAVLCRALACLALTAAHADAAEAVVDFVLIDAVTDQPVAGHDPLLDDDVIVLDANARYNIEALTSQQHHGGVDFELRRNGVVVRQHFENREPFALFGNTDTDFYPWTGSGPQPGAVYTVRAAPHSQPDPSSSPGTALEVRFRFITVDCAGDGDCDDGVFCNGVESCNGGQCLSGGTPCGSGTTCDEAGQRCLEPAGDAAIFDFTLMNADADVPVSGFDPLGDGAVLDDVGLPGLNVRANVSEAVASVHFELREDGALIHSQTESIAAFALFGNTGNDFDPWPGDGPRPGSRYDILAVPYQFPGAAGPAGPPLEVSFEVSEDAAPGGCSTDAECDDGSFCNGSERCVAGACSAGTPPCAAGSCIESTASCATSDLRVASFTLIDADASVPIPAHDPLQDGDVLDPGALPRLSIRINPASSAVDSVRVELREDGMLVHVQVESYEPFALFGDDSGDFSDWPGGPTPGSTYELRAVPYPSNGAMGVPGEALTVVFGIDAAPLPDPDSNCNSDADCDDGLFCNGSERCSRGRCAAGTAPCSSAALCNEGGDTCDTADLLVTRLRLIDADGDAVLGAFDPLDDGDILNLDALPRLNIEALTQPAVVGRVDFRLERQGQLVRAHTEFGAPYALFGNTGSDFWSWPDPRPGFNYTLAVTPYGSDGAVGAGLTVSFALTDAAGLPIADASRTQTVFEDGDGDGQHTVLLDGTASRGVSAALTHWEWFDLDAPGPGFLGSGPTLAVAFGHGSHAVELVVEDADGRRSAGDVVDISVLPVIDRDLGHFGTFSRWQEVEVAFSGPFSSVTAQPNPFDIVVDVTFQGPGGTVVVPAFYDGDGSGGLAGNVWKVRFGPPEVGTWSLHSQSAEPALDGFHGTFDVTPAAQSGPELLRFGPLVYDGRHHLRYADGPYWIKTGMDDPENMLGVAIGDWDAKRDAIDFISARGVNSIYVITNNVEGDRHDTWPWWGDSESEVQSGDNSRRFNVTKLAEWEAFFEYCEARDVVLHIVLDDDEVWTGYDHERYYREMVARFGHHPGIIWNIGEEADEVYSDAQQRQLAASLRAIDPYDHPIAVHRWVTTNAGLWPFIDEPGSGFDTVSIQAGLGGANYSSAPLLDLHAIVSNHRAVSAAAGMPLPIMIDEFPGVDIVNAAIQYDLRREVIWPVLLAGGGLEVHYRDAWSNTGSMTPQTLGPVWEDMQRARQFLQPLPFEDMAPADDLLAGDGSLSHCLALPGTAYGVYLSQGESVDLDLRGVSGSYAVTWFDVRSGATVDADTIHGGAWRSLGTPPFSSDAAAAIVSFEYLPTYRAREDGRR